MTANDITSPEVTEINHKVTSFHRKSPRSGSRRPKNRVLGSFQLLQGCNAQEVAVRDRK